MKSFLVTKINKMKKSFECNSVEEAEALFFKYRADGWRVSKVIKIVWSLRKFKHVAKFEMIKIPVEKPKRELHEVIADIVQKGQEAINSPELLEKARREYDRLKNEKNFVTDF